MLMNMLYLSCLFLTLVFTQPQSFPGSIIIPSDAVKVLVAEKQDGQIIFTLPQIQIDELFNQGPRVAVVEVLDIYSGYQWIEFGVYYRYSNPVSYPFYYNFFDTFTAADNGQNGIDFLIFNNTADMSVSDPSFLSTSLHYQGNCSFDYPSVGFPGGCIDSTVQAGSPYISNEYIQFVNGSYLNGLGQNTARVFIWSGGNCAATERRKVLYTRTQNPKIGTLDTLLAVDPNLDFSTVDFMTCTDCNAGKALIINTRNSYTSGYFTLTCPEYLVDCTYVCPFEVATNTSTIESQSTYIVEQMNSPEYYDFFVENGIFVIPVYDKKREEFQSIKDFTLNVTNCTNLPKVVAFINKFIADTMPGVTLRLTVNGCSVNTNLPAKPQLLYLLILCLLIPVVIILLVGVKLYLGYNWMSSLPYEVSWSFLQYNWSFGVGWSPSGDSESFYYSKRYAKGSADYKKALNILSNYLGGSQLQIKSITAVFNPVLLRNFINNWTLTTERLTNSKPIFGKTSWDTNPNQVWIMEKFKERCNALEWNKNLVCPIIPTAHGTELFLAEKISQTGFANLSKLDAGFFGSGIYFSTNVMYTLPYFAAKKFPAIICSYVVPGNTYPVIEHHKGGDSLMGKPIQSGYNSHYVLTARSGLCISERKEGNIFDEVVIPNEAQICPAFIFEVKNDNFKDLFEDWNRDADEDARGGREEPRNGEMRVFDI